MGGLELMLDADATCSLNDRQAVEEWVRKAAHLAGMHIIGFQSHVLPNGYDSGPGVTVVAVIAESHIAVHTWPEEGIVRASLFSCQPFDVDAQTALFAAAFGVTRFRTAQTSERR